MENCIYCKIIKGEIPNYTLCEDNRFIAFLDINPAAAGHTLIVPKCHCRDLLDLDLESAKEIIQVSQKVAKALKAALNWDGFNIVQNNGQAAGQTIWHYHMHIIPRFDNDNMQLGWAPQKADSQSLLSIQEKVTAFM